MRPHHHNQPRDPQMTRIPRYTGPRSYGRYPHQYSEYRPPNAYPRSFCQTSSFQPKGPAVPPNVSTHSTVKWLNSNFEQFQPWNINRVYSRPKILTPVPTQSRASPCVEFRHKSKPSSTDKAENKSNTRSRTNVSSSDQKSISGSLSEKQVKSEMIDIAQLSELVVVDSKVTDVKELIDNNSSLNSTKEENIKNTDAVDGQDVSSSSSVTSFSISLPPPPWLKPQNTPETEQQSVDESSMVVDTSAELENIPMQSIEAKMETSCSSITEQIEQKINPSDETIRPESQSSMVLEEVQSLEPSEQTNRSEERRKREFPLRKQGKSKKRSRRNRRALISMQRRINRISISEFTVPASSSNIYTNYALSQQSRQRQSNNLSSSYWRQLSQESSQPVQQSYFNTGNPWNSSPSLPNIRMPRPFNTGPRPRLSYPQQPSSFHTNKEKYPIFEKLLAKRKWQ